MIDDWPHAQREAAILLERFRSHSLVHFLAGINRALSSPEAPLQVENLHAGVSRAIAEAEERARWEGERVREGEPVARGAPPTPWMPDSRWPPHLRVPTLPPSTLFPSRRT